MKPFVYGSWSVAMKQLEGVSAVDWVSVCQGSLEQFQGSAVVCSLVQFQEAYPLQCVETLGFYDKLIPSHLLDRCVGPPS